MKTTTNESKLFKLRINEIFEENKGQILNIDELMKVEGGADNDEDWCWISECSSLATTRCYTST